jgi:hypothetical protein
MSTEVILNRRRLQSFQRFWGMGELSIHRWKGFELYPVINKKTVIGVTPMPVCREPPFVDFTQQVRKPHSPVGNYQ